MANYHSSQIHQLGKYGAIATDTKTGQALSATFTAGSAGNCMAIRFIAHASVNLDEIHYFHTAASASPAGNALTTVQVRAALTATTPVTASTLYTTTTTWSGQSGKWRKVSPALALTVNTPYWVCFANAEADAATEFPTIGYAGGIDRLDTQTAFRGFTSTNGFGTNTARTNAWPVALKFSDGRVIGNPWTTSATTFTNGTQERGLYLPAFEHDMSFDGFLFGTTTNVNRVRIYPSTQNPGGTADVDEAISTAATAAGALGCHMFATPWRPARGVAYRIVLDVSANSTAPGAFVMENPDYSDAATVMAAGFLSGNAYATEENGGAWDDFNDSTVRAFPQMCLIPSLGYNGGLLLHPGMTGGIRG